MSERVIFGDWGVSACRLWLCKNGTVLERRTGLGIKFTKDPHADFQDLTKGWDQPPALLCGTVGANIGWRDAGYVDVPATVSNIAERAVTVSGSDVRILPGVRTPSNHFGLPDVMRSEDMQALGWCALSGKRSARLCLPGSHTKWVEVEDGSIVNFTTGYVGELFEVLRKHSTLVSADESQGDSEAFMGGVEVGVSHPAPLSGLFHIRALAAQNLENGAVSRARLSGYLIGADCAAMLRVWGGPPDAIVGDGAIARGYRNVLAHMGADVELADGEASVLSGLRRAADATS